MPQNALLEYICWLSIAVCGIIVLSFSIPIVQKIIRYFRTSEEQRTDTFDYELRTHMLRPGLYILAGQQGAGKGSMGCAIMDTDATYHMEERMMLAQNEVDRLNKLEQDTPYNLELPDMIYYSKNDMQLTPNYTSTNHVDVLQVGLPEDSDDAHFPPYSMLHLEEMDAVLNARTWKDGAQKKANVIDGYKWLRHNDLTVIGDVQVFGRLDAAVRALTTDIFYVYKRKDYYGRDIRKHWWQSHALDDVIVRTEWDFLHIENQLYMQAELINKYGEELIPKDACVRKRKFIYYGNIYERYNSKSGRAYWYKDITRFHSAPHPSTSMTRDAVDDYCVRNARRAENATSETEQ